MTSIYIEPELVKTDKKLNYEQYRLSVDPNRETYADIYIDIPNLGWKFINVHIILTITHRVQLSASMTGLAKGARLKPHYSLDWDSDYCLAKSEDKALELLQAMQIASTQMIYATQVVLNWVRSKYPEYRWIKATADSL